MAAEQTISVCMILRNEEDALGKCLESVRGLADEIIVVDTGSTDRTMEIAREAGAQVLQRDWDDDFSAARNVSLAHAGCDWILCLDADETLDQSARAAVRELLRQSDAMAYYLVFCSSVEGGGAGDVVKSLHPRLFRNHQNLRFEGRIHEEIVQSVQKAGGTIRNSGIEISHSGYQAEVFQNREKFERNIRILNKDIIDRPAFGMNWFYLGENYSLQHQWAEAIEAYLRGAEIGNIPDQNLAVLYQNLGTAFLHAGDHRACLYAEAESLRLNPNQTTPHIVAAQAAFDAGNLDKTIWELTSLLEKLQDETSHGVALVQHAHNMTYIYYLLARAYLGSRNFDAAVHWFQELLRTQPNAVEGICGLAAAEAGRTQYAQAADILKDALARFGERADLLTSLGKVYSRQGEWESAAQALRKARTLAPDDTALCLETASVEFHLKRHTAVVELCNGIPVTDIPPATRLQLAQSFFYTQQIPEARQALEQLQQEPETACEALCLLGSLEEVTGGQRAGEYFMQAARTSGGRAELYFVCGNNLLTRGEYPDALHALETAHNMDPQTREPIFNMAVVHIKTGNLQGAAESFEKLLTIVPDDIDVKRKLAGVYAKMGDEQRAAKLLVEIPED
jgi:tetratricopeptide (TPR) repeat protein